MSDHETTPEKARRVLLTELHEKLIPWASRLGAAQFVLAEPSMAVLPPVKVRYSSGPPLEETAGEPALDLPHTWPEHHLQAARSPRLCCVLTGEIDWRIGITQRIAAQLEGEAAQSNYHVLSMPAGTFFLMPPDVPFEDGSRPHWEREYQQEEARVFWLQILPYGVFCHCCLSVHCLHTGFPSIYIPGPETAESTAELIAVLRADNGILGLEARLVLSRLLGNLEQALIAQRIPQEPFVHAMLRTAPVELALPTDVNRAVRVACKFIAVNLHHPINLEQIARQAGVSPTYLNRCFHTCLGKSVMQFVRERRIHTAKALLHDSQLQVQEIGAIVGYPNQSHFSRIFTKIERITPLRYRELSREEAGHL